MQYKEKKFTQKQLKKIETIRYLINELMTKENIQVHGKQDNLTFVREENIEFAEKHSGGNDIPCNHGTPLSSERIRITDSGADDMFTYPKHIKVI